jgi:hypothetical protein
MTNSGFTIDMTDPTTRRKVQLVSLIGALQIELGTGMKLRSRFSAIAVAQSLGFTGATKKKALQFCIDEMKKLDPNYTPSDRALALL